MNDWLPPSSDIPQHTCICCGASLDTATNMTGKVKPACGDTTICIQCGYVMVFTSKLTMRRPTKKESLRIARNPNITKLKQLIAERNAEKAGRH